ncbi:nitric-oxide reductase large subunit [Thermoactinomyces intermedius]|jgi:nitric oxide reductase subunit B|uniref:Nitric-oxide reductase large subunit n=1 Tax=Thermoactinomyces intermedius TaxID=2024 RepID=A0A8I1DBN6_THEIN|nr:nitric-oxide reductase large subunit [Thermoactinomyces intermedius]MBA4548705.1 nitric-oxide reductase large subunit [Thermoactinomyces intermedius]MBA4836779.1 nitric-oxide reductase large subunit [Thermoactinomyces intermedius]MBH8594583.1 nitric-oxide reductase large subunit [Thermoactinomyces intermedius]
MKSLSDSTLSILKQSLVLTIIISFTVLLAGGFWIYKEMAPRPAKVISPHGEVMTTAEKIKGGQAVYQKYGLMDYGSVLGHGSYLGPDYTAETLHLTVTAMQDYKAKQMYHQPFSNLSADKKAVIQEKVKNELKKNRYNAKTDTLMLTDAQVYALQQVRKHYVNIFTKGDGHGILPGLIHEEDMPLKDRKWVAEGNQLEQIADFFFWTAWLSGTERPDGTSTYTNNWPYDPEAGNQMGYSTIWWSAASVALLIGLTGLVLYFYQRYKLDMHEAYKPGRFPVFDLSSNRVTPSQIKTGKFFLVVALMFLVQTGFGGLLAHYYLEPGSFYGWDWIAEMLPFNIAKGYHLQLAIFWIATAWLGLGIYVSPLVGGKEPKRQGLLVDILFWSLVILVAGSMTGQWLGVNGYLGNLWFLLGHQGWEYLELGRIWQWVLAIGMGLWLFIVWRGFRDGLRSETDKGGLLHLLFYSAIAVPFFYIFAFFYDPGTNITYADYWRWWIIHLWVEGIFEVFAVVIIGFLMVQMKLVTKKSTIRALYFQLIVLLAGGVIGTGHHYYWIGAPDLWIGLGAVFSAIEVIPLTLLILEAYGQYKVLVDGGSKFPYRASFWFLISTAVWNLIGAGVLGFLINLPSVSYFEHGSFLTPAHGHGAMMGVYGMFAIAVLLFTLRNIVRPEKWTGKTDKILKISCWGLNIGLAGMILITLLPVGMVQLQTAFEQGFWVARDPSFYQDGLVRVLLWLRIIPDSIFILAGVVPLVWAVVRAMFHLRKSGGGM